MSTFASTALSGNVLNVAQLVAELNNELPTRQFIDSVATGFAAATPASYTTVTGLSRTIDCEADETITLISVLNVSCGTAGDKIAAQHFNDASAAGLIYWFTEPVGRNTGDSGTLTVLTRYENRTGSIAFSTKWIRGSGSGSIYCKEGSSQLITVAKKRS